MTDTELTVLLAERVMGALMLAPDFDLDGDVDQADWGIMQAQLGEPGMPFSVCDLNWDGVVDEKDVELFEKWPRKAR